MQRLFVAIQPPLAVRERLLAAMGGVINARWQSDEQLHLTLRFIGEVDEGVASDIDAALARIRAPRFDVTLAGIGHFGGDAPRLLWVGVESNAALFHLRDKIEAALIRAGLAPETRRYSPHVTLARLKQVATLDVQEFMQANALFRAAPFPVERFTLIASYPTKSGAIYEDQAEYPLR